ncbi:hypothetical protein [Jiangella alkaliphila]|uniref:hypothetical protein n=1 Tax=Jiangella alkaliphila TaxID=419479 RepID=UPI0018D3D7D9|nr:hypothetical protein [Jiangella alkaliphila]
MFTRDERTALRDALVAAARADDRIDGAALTGSAARDAEDGWSDIHLAARRRGAPRRPARRHHLPGVSAGQHVAGGHRVRPGR